MALNISLHNIPHAFAHITELSQLPNESTYDVIFNNKTIDQAVANVPDMLGDDYWDLQDTDSDPMFSDSGRFPDVIDQAIYQTENPNAVLTPWGPALDPMEVSNIMEDYFGADSLVGMDASETQALFDEADAIIDNNGEQLDEIVNQADATAMAENLNANDVAINLFDEIASQGTAIPTPLTSPVPGDMDEGDLSLFDRLTGLQSAEASTNVAGQGTVAEPDDQGGPGFWEQTMRSANQLLSDPLATGTSAMTQRMMTTNADIEFLNSLLDLPDDEIIDEIRLALSEGSLFPDSVAQWVQSHPEWSRSQERTQPITDTLVNWEYGDYDPVTPGEVGSFLAARPELGQNALDLASMYQEGAAQGYNGDLPPTGDLPAQQYRGIGAQKVPDVSDSDTVAALAAVASPAGRPELTTVLNQVFFQAYDNTTDQYGRQYTAIPERMNNYYDRQDEAETLFYLHMGDEINQIGLAPGLDAYTAISNLYAQFLEQYIANESAFKTGPVFNDKIQALRSQLLQGTRNTAYGQYVFDVFGDNPAMFDADGRSPAAKRRNILIDIYNTGSALTQSPSVEATKFSHEQQGLPAAQTFHALTMPKYSPVTPQDGQQLDLFPSDTVTTGTPAQPFQYDRTGLIDPALSFSPELYSPGTQRFGVPGETMAMRYQRFREDPLVPRPMVYDRTGMRDPRESLTSELLGGTRDAFVDNQSWRDAFVDDQSWRDDPMIIPGINAAALPIQGPEDLNQAQVDALESMRAARREAVANPWRTLPVSEHMYSEAMARLKAARGERMPGGTTYKPYESTVAVPDIAPETIDSMPTPFNQEQAERRDKGLPYRQGRWTGGTKAQFDRLSARDKRTIMAGDLWVAGTTFVPTKGYTR